MSVLNLFLEDADLDTAHFGDTGWVKKVVAPYAGLSTYCTKFCANRTCFSKI